MVKDAILISVSDKPIRSSQSNKSPISSPKGSGCKLLSQFALGKGDSHSNLLKSFDKSAGAKRSKNLSSHANHGHSQNDGSCQYDKFSSSSADHFMLGEDNLGDLAKDMGIFNFSINADSNKKTQNRSVKKVKTQISPRGSLNKAVPRRKSFDELDISQKEPQQPYTRKVIFKSNEKSGEYNQYLKE